MQILKNQATCEILTPNIYLEQILPLIEKAGRTCYRSENKTINHQTATKFARKLLLSHHESVIEHAVLTVRFSQVSRGFTHEMVRHRLASYSQESTRYVDYTKSGNLNLGLIDIQIIAPPHRDEEETLILPDGRLTSFSEMAAEIEIFYQTLRQAGWKPEDARQILPIGLSSQIVVTTNLREWRHIFSLRTAKPAHWEIRTVMCQLLQQLQEKIPVIFDDFILQGEDKNGVPYYQKKT